MSAALAELDAVVNVDTLRPVLQFAGTRLVTHTLDDAENVYGTFAATLALLSWLSLHALISLLGAELNGALCRRPQPTDP